MRSSASTFLRHSNVLFTERVHHGPNELFMVHVPVLLLQVAHRRPHRRDTSRFHRVLHTPALEWRPRSGHEYATRVRTLFARRSSPKVSSCVEMSMVP